MINQLILSPNTFVFLPLLLFIWHFVLSDCQWALCFVLFNVYSIHSACIVLNSAQKLDIFKAKSGLWALVHPRRWKGVGNKQTLAQFVPCGTCPAALFPKPGIKLAQRHPHAILKQTRLRIS
ncbi:uncharacterized protein LOC112897385 [Panicum hallii]|uniref:uncharacterized protein LOC112897385 n=1 Tax=Panicum hallii TaxID=206008 RepID=UPI000DF4DE59|nr:uncharacterized protein LOC112897385 [Panicum hallii]